MNLIRLILTTFFWRVLRKISNYLYIKLRYVQFITIKRKVGNFAPTILNKTSSFNIDKSLLSDDNISISNTEIDKILKGNFQLLGAELKSMPPDWHIDEHSQKRWEVRFYESMNPLSTNKDNWDKKIPWEKSRLQFLIPLSRKYLLEKDKKLLRTIEIILNDWIDKNPPFYGINWSNSMEVGIRAINMIFCIQLLGGVLNNRLMSKINKSLLFHLHYIEANPEIDFKIKNGFIDTIRNNHFIFGCTGALYISSYFNYNQKVTKYISLLENEVEYQFYEDGGNFEHSLPYHFFTFEAYVMVAFLNKIDKITLNKSFIDSIVKIANFTRSVIKPDGSIPKFGDNDSGCIIWHHDLVQLHSKVHLVDLAAIVLDKNYLFWSLHPSEFSWICKMLLKGKPLSNNKKQNKHLFYKDSGILISKNVGNYLGVYIGPQNSRHLTAGHAHNDCMSFELSINNNVVFTNRGTLTYADINNRNNARESSSHNVCVIDDHEINRIILDRPFSMDYTLRPFIDNYENNGDLLNFTFSHNGFQDVNIKKYNRTFSYNNKSGECLITDMIESKGKHNIEWYFHTPNSDVSLNDSRVIITIINKKYYLSSDNSFDSISIQETKLWPEYGVEVKGNVIRYKLNDFVRKNNYSFKIGEIK